MIGETIHRGTTPQAPAPARPPPGHTRRPRPRRHRLWAIVKGAVVALGALVALGGGVLAWGLHESQLPAALNMGTAGASMTMPMAGMPAHMPMPAGPTIAMSSLVAPATTAPVRTFTLTARAAHLPLGDGSTADAWTYNGTSPGPTLRVRQGDLVVVHLVNHLAVGVTIHWHGVAVPNAEDGVAGLTQDAVTPGHTYTYRFIATDAGTYWYHSHQESYDETRRGLYGLLIVAPARPTLHDDVDAAVALHSWTRGTLPFGPLAHEVEAINATVGTTRIAARPGQWVRLRIANTESAVRVVTLVGAPFTVVALDAHDLNGPTPLTATPLQIGSGQRDDLRFRMPPRGPVALLTVDDAGRLRAAPAVVAGSGAVPVPLPSMGRTLFDLTTYGTPRPDPITVRSHVDTTYTMTLGGYIGFWAGRVGPVYTINGAAFPSVPALLVTRGQLVKVHIVNTSGDIHEMHLHGHSFRVLTRDGRPLTGSPIYVDTVLVQAHTTYDVAFRAHNPGLWMFHCHNLYHANWGMDMMVVYPHISTPYTIGRQSGNFPD